MSAGRFFVLILIRFACPAVAAGRHTRYLFEGLGKVAGGGKATGTADDRKRGIMGEMVCGVLLLIEPVIT